MDSEQAPSPDHNAELVALRKLVADIRALPSGFDEGGFEFTGTQKLRSLIDDHRDDDDNTWVLITEDGSAVVALPEVSRGYAGSELDEYARDIVGEPLRVVNRAEAKRLHAEYVVKRAAEEAECDAWLTARREANRVGAEERAKIGPRVVDFDFDA